MTGQSLAAAWQETPRIGEMRRQERGMQALQGFPGRGLEHAKEEGDRPWEGVLGPPPSLSRPHSIDEAARAGQGQTPGSPLPQLLWLLHTRPSLSAAFSATQARKGFWDYFSQTSGDKGRVEQIHQQKMAREPASLKDSLEQDLNNMNKFLEKLRPLSGSEAPRFPQDPAGMRQQLQEELEEVKARLQPYMAEAHELVGWNLEGLRQQLKPYTMDLMEQVALRVQELQEQLRVVGEDTKAQLLGGVDEARALLQELQSRVVNHTGRFREFFHPYAESLVSGIGRHVQELHRRVASHAPASPARLSRCVQVLSRKLTLKAKALHTRIQQNLDQLRDELSRAFAGTGTEEGAGPDPQMLSEEVRQRLQAFRQDTYLQIAAFTRAIDQETEEVQQQLAPPPPGHSAFTPEFQQTDSGKVLSKLQARLDDLWEDITHSLHDQGHSHLGEP
ncbi:apolipoprotein A-V [Chlorocebus sabaeus]|uniref:apolipoprotein A-V n=1 Tax=Chlorocebus sabaeus TaxID=60711 RepID=UPI003BFA12A5